MNRRDKFRKYDHKLVKIKAQSDLGQEIIEMQPKFKELKLKLDLISHEMLKNNRLVAIGLLDTVAGFKKLQELNEEGLKIRQELKELLTNR